MDLVLDSRTLECRVFLIKQGDYGRFVLFILCNITVAVKTLTRRRIFFAYTLSLFFSYA